MLHRLVLTPTLRQVSSSPLSMPSEVRRPAPGPRVGAQAPRMPCGTPGLCRRSARRGQGGAQFLAGEENKSRTGSCRYFFTGLGGNCHGQAVNNIGSGSRHSLAHQVPADGRAVGRTHSRPSCAWRSSMRCRSLTRCTHAWPRAMGHGWRAPPLSSKQRAERYLASLEPVGFRYTPR